MASSLSAIRMRGHITLLLPAWSTFGRQGLLPDVARWLGRADALPMTDIGRRAQILRRFSLTPAHWAPAAITRQVDAGDAANAIWLRADPAYVRPDINGARLLAYGDALSLTQADADALLPALKPVFGDAGFMLDAPNPSRWYLRMPIGAEWPDFSEPYAALGEDLFEHQPQGAAGKRWRALLNEAQIVLHNHPWNAHRAGRGLAPVNALWLWGGGMLPHAVHCEATQVYSEDDLLRAMAVLAGAQSTSLSKNASTAHIESADAAYCLHDVSTLRDLQQLQRNWLMPVLKSLYNSEISILHLDSEDGSQLVIKSAHRLRFWRKPWTLPT